MNKATTSERVKALRRQLGLTQAEFGALAGVTKGAVSLWEKGYNAPGRDAIDAICRKKQINRYWLLNGAGSMYVTSSLDGADIVSMVPVIQLELLTAWLTSKIDNKNGEWKTVPCIMEVTKSAFALFHSGDVMSPEIPDGCAVIFEPDKQAVHDCFVLAAPTKDEPAILRRLVVDGARRYLKPINDRYPVIELTADGKIYGVAVAMNKTF